MLDDGHAAGVSLPEDSNPENFGHPENTVDIYQ